MALVLAARKGDPAAFARVVEHWNPHLRPFVHHVLAGGGSADRALSAAYVRAYRALPRYRAERKPGLWLHRIAYLAATDELRRVRRDPARRRALADAGRTENDTDEVLRLDQWALDPHFYDHHVDRDRAHEAGADHRHPTEPDRQHHPDPASVGETAEGGTAETVPGSVGEVSGPSADAHHQADEEPESAIIEARNLIELAGGSIPEPAFPPGWRRLAPDQRALAVMVDLEGYRIEDAAAALDSEVEPAADRLHAARRLLARNRTGAVGLEPTDPHGEEALISTAREALAEVAVPPADPDFWSMLGRRLLAEREAPAAPSIDPIARLAKAHPAEPGFKPSKHLRPLPGDPGYDPVQGLAEQADWSKPPRRWKRFGIAAAVVLVVAACIGVAVWVGTSSRIPDGSEAASDLVQPVAEAMAAGPYRRLAVTVTEEDSSGRSAERGVTVILANDGSWVVSQTGTIDQTTYDAASGLVRRTAVIGSGEGAELVVNDTQGLAAGPPDPSPSLPSPLTEIQAVPTLLRLAGDDRVSRRTVADQRVWALDHTLPTGDQGAEERWTVLVDRETSLPVTIERNRGERLVRRVHLDRWETVPEVPGDTFVPPAPVDVSPTSSTHGFVTTELAAVPLLGRGDAVTPGWLPSGYELEVVAVRPDPPAGAASTAAGANPPDEDVLSLGFQRGFERITVTTRSAGVDRAAWRSPFADAVDDPKERTLGDGRFNGARASAGTDVFGRTRLWVISGDTVLTVSGDLTVDDAFKLAASLR